MSKGQYNLKGNAFNKIKLFIDKNPADGMKYSDFFKQSQADFPEMLIPSSWYNVDIYYQIINLYSIRRKIPLTDLIQQLAEYSLESDLNGIYKFIMKVGGPKRVLSSALPMVKTYFDYVNITVLNNSDGNLEFESVLPTEYVELSIPADRGAVSGMLKACGAMMKGFEVLSVISLNETHSKIHYRVRY